MAGRGTFPSDTISFPDAEASIASFDLPIPVYTAFAAELIRTGSFFLVTGGALKKIKYLMPLRIMCITLIFH
jgi:hypothetical protein